MRDYVPASGFYLSSKGFREIRRVCFVLILGGRIYSMTANVLPEGESMIQNESYDIATDCIASSAGMHPENLTMVHFPAHGISPSEESYNLFLAPMYTFGSS